MTYINQIVKTIAKEWTMGPSSNPMRKQAQNIVSGIFDGINSKSAKLTDTVEKEAKKYLDTFCRVFKEGKYTVIEHQWGGTVDVTKIGKLNNDGTIIRCKTLAQAEAEAKKILMEQFKLPKEKQKELCLITKDRDLFLNSLGDAHETKLPSVIDDKTIAKYKLKIFHNHPTNAECGKSYPLSIEDIVRLASDEVQSITAINSLGEFNSATIKVPFKSPGYSVSQYLLQILKNRLEPILGEGVFPDKNPELYIKEVHKAYKEILPQLGIEYNTNYSYLSKL